MPMTIGLMNPSNEPLGRWFAAWQLGIHVSFMAVTLLVVCLCVRVAASSCPPLLLVLFMYPAPLASVAYPRLARTPPLNPTHYLFADFNYDDNVLRAV